MRLESVRELKADLRERSHAESGLLETRLLSAGRPQAIGQGRPAVSLGASPTPIPGEYRLAIRLQRREVDPLAVQRLVDAARGEADVEYMGVGFKQNTALIRPLIPGLSIGHPDITAGTLGCFVEAASGVCILSNNHVLADENRAHLGDSVLQPGPYDGGSAADAVAELVDFEPLALGVANPMDAAIASLSGGVEFAAHLSGQAALGPAAEITGAERVTKIGRSTGLTRGSVVAFDLDDVPMDYEIGRLRFDGVIQIRGTTGPLTGAGDSGSLVYTDEPEPRPLGLHFGAVPSGDSVASPIGPILDRFAAQLLT